MHERFHRVSCRGTTGSGILCLSCQTFPPLVPAADQTLRILSLLARQARPVAAADDRDEPRIPRSSVYHLHSTLEQHGYVVHLPAIDAGGSAPTRPSSWGGGFTLRSTPRTPRPTAAAPRSCRIAWERAATRRARRSRRALHRVDERAPAAPGAGDHLTWRAPSRAHLTATGRAMLAALPREQVRATLPDATALTQRHAWSRDSARAARAPACGARGRSCDENGEVTPGFPLRRRAVRCSTTRAGPPPPSRSRGRRTARSATPPPWHPPPPPPPAESLASHRPPRLTRVSRATPPPRSGLGRIPPFGARNSRPQHANHAPKHDGVRAEPPPPPPPDASPRVDPGSGASSLSSAQPPPRTQTRPEPPHTTARVTE